MSTEDLLNRILGSHVGSGEVTDFNYLSGGCIHQAVKVNSKSGTFFIKWNDADTSDMFDTEAKSLGILRGKSRLGIPEILGQGRIDGKSYLLMEYIRPGHRSQDFWIQFGIGLAELHQNTNDRYGLHFDNYIGSLHQRNTQKTGWIDFYTHERLGFQIKLALSAGVLSSKEIDLFEKLFESLPNLLPTEKPALLHGDLWSGNFLCNHQSVPYLIDPAVYFGNREIEIAFTHMFGGFDADFYQSYNEAYPIINGFEERIDLYQLYPFLVHLNLFGKSYLGAIQRTLRHFVGR